MRARRRSIPARRHFLGAGDVPPSPGARNYHGYYYSGTDEAGGAAAANGRVLAAAPVTCAYCKRALNRDRVYFKCEECSDNGEGVSDNMDMVLCVDCYSVGAALEPHRATHSYSVVERYSALEGYAHDWSMKEELDLLDAMTKHGALDWRSISADVGTKSAQKCQEHYHKVYLDHEEAPLPKYDATGPRKRRRVIPVSPSSPCASSTDNNNINNNNITPAKSPLPQEEELLMDDEPDTPRAARAKLRSAKKAAININGNNIDSKGKKNSNTMKRGKKKNNNNSMNKVEVAGYVDKRGEFEVEFDDEAENAIADLEVTRSDTPQEIELKVALLELYNERLKLREKMKKYILEGIDDNDEENNNNKIMYNNNNNMIDNNNEAKKKTDAIRRLLKKEEKKRKKEGAKGRNNNNMKSTPPPPSNTTTTTTTTATNNSNNNTKSEAEIDNASDGASNNNNYYSNSSSNNNTKRKRRGRAAAKVELTAAASRPRRKINSALR